MKPTRRLIFLQLEKELLCSVQKLCEVVGINGVNVRRELSRMHDDGMAYIKEYHKPPRGNYIPMWALGDKPHRPAPTPLAPGLAKASAMASRYAHKVKELRDKAERLRMQADALEERASKYANENEKIKVLTKLHVERPRSVPNNVPRASPWSQLIR